MDKQLLFSSRYVEHKPVLYKVYESKSDLAKRELNKKFHVKKTD